MVIYFATLPLLLSKDVSKVLIGFRIIDYLSYTFPNTFPIYFYGSYAAALVRMKVKGIIGTEPEKTVEAANLRIMCFDKTGTLTEN